MDDKEMPEQALNSLNDAELDDRGKYPFEKPGFFKDVKFDEEDMYGDPDDPMYFHLLDD